MFYPIARSALFALDPEVAHHVALRSLNKLHRLHLSGFIGSRLSAPRTVMGLEFDNPVGLAAGLDKNGEYIDALAALGFGFIEVGTVTPRAQPGNPKPRMFRLTENDALINRLGFNNQGLDAFVANVKRAKYKGVLGLNIGKNFDTPIDSAEADYVACLRKVYAHADYLAVNISSPNTARLRELQGRDGLERIIGALMQERALLKQRHARHVPVLVKIAPDLAPEQIKSLAASLRSLDVEGVIATNTSTDLGGLGPGWPEEHRGGLSGAPLQPLSLSVIRQLRVELGPNFPIIGVGGIVSAASAAATLSAGANLVQIYTGFASRGYGLLEEIFAAWDRSGQP